MDFRKPRQIGRSWKPSTTCKKHPKHQQSPGVCSICLNEKLSRLSSGSFRRNRWAVTTASSSSSLSSVSSLNYSSNASSCGSPVRLEARSGPLILLRAAGKDVLTKSRSVATVWRKREGDNCSNKKEKKKKSSFWSKLLRLRGKRVNEG